MSSRIVFVTVAAASWFLSGDPASTSLWPLPWPALARAQAAAYDDGNDIVRFSPPHAQTTVRGREVALRFGLGRRFELSLQVNNAFAAQNRRSIARAEASIAEIPGVRRVIGPSGLRIVEVGAAGPVSSGPLLAGGPGDEASEVVRQRLIRRSDAIGWFISRDGTGIRVLFDTDDLPAVQGAIETAVASSGLVLLSGVAPASPLWPEPARAPRPFPGWLPFALVALAMLPGALAVAFSCHPKVSRALLVTLATGLGAAAPGALAPAGSLRMLAAMSGVGAATLMALLIVIGRVLGRHRGHRTGRAVVTRRLRVPLTVLFSSVVLVALAVVAAPRLSMGTQLWHKTSVFFVEIRGDMDEPVVLREVRRLTDFLRTEPGVAHAWSIADLFFAVPATGESFGGIPTAPDSVRRIFDRARDDTAVRLELAPDHRSALVGVRLDEEESGVDRLSVLVRLEQYLLREHRPALLRIDTSDVRLSPTARGLGRGILAADARERVLRICARSGRILSDSDIETVERSLRRAALVPVVDPPKFRAELGREVGSFLQRSAAGWPAAESPRAPEVQRLLDQLLAQPADVSVADVLASLRSVWGRQLPEAMLPILASEVHRRLTMVRRRHTARIHFNDILYGADLPTEGVLSEEVRDATLDAMDPLAGVPVGRDVPGAFGVDALALGGAPCDRALSAAWLPGMLTGILMAAALLASLLAAIGGLPALAWWPATLAPLAPLIAVPAFASVPIGALYVAVLAGVLAGGAAFATGFAPGRRDR